MRAKKARTIRRKFGVKHVRLAKPKLEHTPRPWWARLTPDRTSSIKEVPMRDIRSRTQNDNRTNRT